VAVGLSSSQTGVSYQLFRGASPVGSPVAGTGSAISFGNQTTVGTYTVVATNTTTGCTSNMTGSAVVTANSLVVTNGNDSGAGSLRDVLATACAGSTITFQTGVTTVTLTTAELSVGASVTINGGTGVTVTRGAGSPNFRIFNILSGNTVSMNNLTVTNGNGTGDGGGILSNGALTLTNCTISGNTASNRGGGLFVLNASATLTGCTINGNTSTNFGAGAFQSTSVTLTNCTVSGNTGSVGGLAFDNSSPATLTNCSVANNSSFGIVVVSSSRATSLVTLVNTMVLDTINGFVSLTSFNNLVQGIPGLGAAGGLVDGTDGNLVNVANPRVGTLGNYGGATQTLALLPGSPAINAGTATGAPTTDQRGIARVGNVDIGAFESRGFTMALSGGNNQSAPIGANFASPLAVTVASAFGEPVDGGGVTFTSPGSGASASVAGNPATIASGTATTGTVTANGTPGGPYVVAASANGVATGVNFSLTNACPTITAFSVTGGGSFCSGGTGVAVGLSGSQTGVSYQLFNGASPVGSPVAGTGSALNFGNQTTAGTYTVVGAFGATGCTANMTGSATVTVNALPTAFNVTGGGSFCSGGTGVAVGLSGSQTGVNYQLFNGASPVGSPVAGTGSAISFGNQTTAGTYTVVATATTGSCTSNMTGSAVVTVNALPAIFNVTGGGGTSCVGGSGVAVGLSGSETGVNYQLFNGATPLGSPVAGTGSALNFGNQTTAGTYTVVATNSTTGCTSNMSGNAVVTVVSAPTAFNVTGGGSFCAGGTGVAVGLSGSETGVNYQLFRGASPVGSPVAGTGSALSLGIQTTAGTYTVVGTNATAGCSTNMTGSAVVTVNPTPSIFNVTGGGSFCTGGTGVAVGLSGSQTGVNYQLFNGASPVGSPVAGTGSALNFGNQTTAGTYTVVATNGTTGCTSNMSGSAVVTVTTCQPTVTTNPATGVSSTGATLNGTVTANGDSTTVLFRYGTTAGGPYPNVIAATPSPVTGTTPTTVSATLTGLATNQIYYFVVEGSNVSGTSQGAEQSFSTATCSFQLSASSANFPASGGNGSVTLTTTTGCVWTVSGLPDWIINVSPANGTGTTAITYTVNPNLSQNPRSATLTIGGQSYTVNQDPSVQVNGSIGLAITGQTVLPTSCGPNYANDYVITATLTNTGSQPIYNPYLRVLELQEAAGSPAPPVPFRLITADGATCGTGGLVGSIQSTDGQTTPATLPTLAPGQSVTVRLVIALPSLRRFRFIFGVDGSFTAPVAMKGRASKAGFAKTFTLARQIEPSTGTAFVFIPSADGKTMNIVPVQPELEAFLNLGDNFWAGLNQARLASSTKHP
jgi:parallel beta-helix repeat protein